MKKGLKKFLVETHSGNIRYGKNVARSQIVKESKKYFGDYKGLRCLTLPGCWMHFEKKMKKAFSGLKPTFTICEKNKVVYRNAVMKFATAYNKPISVSIDHKLSCDVVSNNVNMVAYNCNVFDYLTVNAMRPYGQRKYFNLIWLDLLTPITEQVITSINTIQDNMRSGKNEKSMFVLTVMLARELINIDKNRMEFIIDSIENGLNDFCFYQACTYNDGSPMGQYIFVK